MVNYILLSNSIESGILDRSPLNCLEWNLLWHFIKQWIITRGENIDIDEQNNLDVEFINKMKCAFKELSLTETYKILRANKQVCMCFFVCICVLYIYIFTDYCIGF